MNIPPVSSPSSLPMRDAAAVSATSESLTGKNHPPGEVARQFEAILVRQMLTETMKPLLENGKEGHMYGYFITEALADGITKGGGLGIRSVIEAQLHLRESDVAARSEL